MHMMHIGVGIGSWWHAEERLLIPAVQSLLIFFQ